MKPWPRHVRTVSDHALLRYLARIEKIDVAAIEAWLRSNQAPADAEMIFSVLESRGTSIEGVRAKMLADADAHKRQAEQQEDGSWRIPGKTAVYALSKLATILTAMEVKAQ